MTKSLADYRKERYMEVDEFVRFVGITLGTYYRILNGESARISTMKKIAGKLGVHPSEILEFASKSS